MRLDVDSLAVEIVAIGDEPANPYDVAVDRGGDAKCDVGGQKIRLIGFDPSHPPGLGARESCETDQK